MVLKYSLNLHDMWMCQKGRIHVSQECVTWAHPGRSRFGRVAKRCFGIVTHAYSAPISSLSSRWIDALRRFVASLNANVPRTLSRKCDVTLHAFSDASHEPDAHAPVSGIGPVLVNNDGKKLCFLSPRAGDKCFREENCHFRT